MRFPAHRRVGSVAAVGACVLVAAARGQTAGAPPPELLNLLQKDLGFSKQKSAQDIAGGRAVTTLLPKRRTGEVAVAGLERVGVPLEFFLDAFRQTPVFNRGGQTLVTGEFSSPPRTEDMQKFMLDENDAQALGHCSPGHCSVKLSASMMDDLRGAGGDSTSIDAQFRSEMVQHLVDYQAHGDSAMPTYADKHAEANSARTFQDLLKESDWLSKSAPPLYKCLRVYEGGSCPEIDSFFYWSSAKFGLKPVFSITHVMIYRTVKNGLPWVFVALKQIYADHYFDASLGVAVLVEDPARPPEPSLWVLYLNRARTDALTGVFGPIERSVTESRSQSALRSNLAELKKTLESRYAVSPGFPEPVSVNHN